MTPILVAAGAVLLVLFGVVGRQWSRYRSRYLTAQKTLAKQDAEIVRLTEQVRHSQGQNRQQEDAIAQLTQRLHHLQTQAEDSCNEISLSQHEVHALRSAKVALEQSLAHQTEQMAALNRDHQQTVAQLNQTITTLNQAQTTLSQDLQESKQALAQLYQDIEDTIAEEAKDYTEQITQLTATVAQLESAQQAVVSARRREHDRSILIKATEDDLYPEEKKAMVLDVLQRAIDSLPEGSRRETVIQNIVDSNRSQFHRDTLRTELRKWFKAYNGMNRKMRHALEQLGFEIETEGVHYKMRFQGDGRYKLTFAKTPSDWRNGRNIIQEIRNRFL